MSQAGPIQKQAGIAGDFQFEAQDVIGERGLIAFQPCGGGSLGGEVGQAAAAEAVSTTQRALTELDIDGDVHREGDHIVIVFPIWFGGLPAHLKGFFEQLLRRGFALSSPSRPMQSLLTGKSARLIVTMGLPTTIFHLVLGGHGLGALERGLFWVTGVQPVRHTILGGALKPSPARVARWFSRMEALGRAGA